MLDRRVIRRDPRRRAQGQRHPPVAATVDHVALELIERRPLANADDRIPAVSGHMEEAIGLPGLQPLLIGADRREMRPRDRGVDGAVRGRLIQPVDTLTREREPLLQFLQDALDLRDADGQKPDDN